MEKEYWKKYYKNKLNKTLPPPSQFAAFTISYLNSYDLTVIDYASGDGRDSVFFSNYFSKVYTVDQVQGISETEITKHENLEFLYPENLSRSNIQTDNCIVYARFFLHAISDEEQSVFMQNMKELLLPNEKIFLEFRVDEDSTRTKATEAHYRRFQTMNEVIEQLKLFDFKTLYSVQGMGFAMYKEDDAFVARIVAERI